MKNSTGNLRIKKLLEEGKHLLQAVTDVPRLEAEILLAAAIGKSRIEILTSLEEMIDAQAMDKFHSFLQRRLQQEPIAYIRETKEFYGVALKVSPAVLIPRPDTEIVLEEALRYIPKEVPSTVIDVCTGSGCLAILIAMLRPHATVYATDISPQALEIAAENSQTYGLSQRFQLRQGNLLEACQELREVDVVVGNPPYIKEQEFETLMPDVKNYEPSLALLGEGEEGLLHHERLIKAARPILRSNGVLILEIGSDQGKSTLSLAHEGYEDPVLFKDLAHLTRGAIWVKRE